jgi:hypothetical protein
MDASFVPNDREGLRVEVGDRRWEMMGTLLSPF